MTRVVAERASLRTPTVADSPSTGAVLMVSQHPFPEHIVFRRNVLELLEDGFEIDVVCLSGSEPLNGLATHPRLRLRPVRVQHRRGRAIRYLFEYAAFFLSSLCLVSALSLRRRYDAVQVDNLPDLLVFTTIVPRLRGVRVVFNMFELTPEMVAARFSGRLGAVLTRVASWVEAAATSWADHVIVVSQECWERVHRRGVPEEKLSIVLNTTSWPSPTADASKVPARDGEASFLVVHSTLVERYGIDVAIRAFAQLASRWPRLTLRVIGDGEQRAALEALAQQLRVGNRVVFTGQLPWTETIAQVMQATIGIVSVLADGYGEVLLPTKLLEYARFGVPAVCSRLAAVRPYFPDGSITYFEPGNADDLAAVIERLLEEPGIRKLQAGHAQEVARGLSWERVRHSYLQALALDSRVMSEILD